jgi:hypothetical protein
MLVIYYKLLDQFVKKSQIVNSLNRFPMNKWPDKSKETQGRKQWPIEEDMVNT